MHSNISKNEENTTENSETNSIVPKSKSVEAKRAQNRGTGYFDVDAVFVVHEREVADFVYDQTLKAVVED